MNRHHNAPAARRRQCLGLVAVAVMIGACGTADPVSDALATPAEPQSSSSGAMAEPDGTDVPRSIPPSSATDPPTQIPDADPYNEEAVPERRHTRPRQRQGPVAPGDLVQIDY